MNQPRGSSDADATRHEAGASITQPATNVSSDEAGSGEWVTVTAASRLHFGLLSWGGTGRQFGGVGLMVEEPAVQVRVTRATQFHVSGPHGDRVFEFAQRWFASRGDEQPATVRIEVLAAPPQHVGLGLGTQLGLAVGAALARLVERSAVEPVELARRMGRGLRSAVGTYGFFHGGLVVEPGKLAYESLAPSCERFDLPDPWRVVLIRPATAAGEAGESERRAFATLPAVPPERTDRLWGVLRGGMLPALTRGDCAAFGEALYEYGRLAGECFAPWQGGPFNGPSLTQYVEQLRAWGVNGVGQSSWGPTLFAIVDSPQAALHLVDRLRATHADAELDVLVTRAARAGARVEDSTGVRFAHG